MPIVKYLWPVWLGMLFQFSWNGVMMVFHGNFNSRFGDWIYSRNCDYAMTCDGNRVLWWVWLAIGTLIIVNAVFQFTRARLA